MEILQLRYFETAAKLENISRAAEYHRIPQPAMSKTISRLEKEVGTTLFNRTNNRLQLNENGRIFLYYVERALNNLDDAVSALQEQDALKGEIKLLVLENRRVVTDCIAQFKHGHPDMMFQIIHSCAAEQNTEFDLCVSAFAPQKSGLEQIPLIHEELRLAVAAADPLAGCSSVSFSQLRDRRFVLLPESNSLHRIVMAEGTLNGFRPQIGILCDDPMYVRKYVSMGLGITLAPMVSWKALFGSDTVLLPLNKDEHRLRRTTYLFWHNDRYLSPAVRLFRDLLVSGFAAESV